LRKRSWSQGLDVVPAVAWETPRRKRAHARVAQATTPASLDSPRLVLSLVIVPP
jgi:hypothetical protein